MPGAYHRILGTGTHRHVNIEALDHLGSIGGCDPGVTQATEECPQLFVRGLLGTLRVIRSFAPEIIGVAHLAFSRPCLVRRGGSCKQLFGDGLNEMAPPQAQGGRLAGPRHQDHLPSRLRFAWIVVNQTRTPKLLPT